MNIIIDEKAKKFLNSKNNNVITAPVINNIAFFIVVIFQILNLK